MVCECSAYTARQIGVGQLLNTPRNGILVVQYLVFSMTPICWLRSMSSINCFCSIFSLPTVCLMNTCCSRSSTFGLSSKSLIRHLWGGEKKRERRRKGNLLDLYSNYIWLSTVSVNIYYSGRKTGVASTLTCR